jgi:hypothetical protein
VEESWGLATCQHHHGAGERITFDHLLHGDDNIFDAKQQSTLIPTLQDSGEGDRVAPKITAQPVITSRRSRFTTSSPNNRLGVI